MAPYTRALIHVPILHSPTDMGALADQIETAYVEMFGRQRWAQHVEQLDGFWKSLAGAIDALGLDYRTVDIYQDGLPVCGRELQIAREAAAESENYRLVVGLVERGARLIGTEDPGLLVEEYQAIKASADSRAEAGAAVARPAAVQAPAGSTCLLDRRDAFIAQRIAETLEVGRTGLLFLGLLHDVRRYLPADIVVRRAALLDPLSG